MITAIIFSKDRAVQLRLLLESIRRNAITLFDKIYIIFNASHEDFIKGYNKLHKENILKNIFWIKEKNLQQDVFNVLNNNFNNFITFLTDDSILYRFINDQKFVIESSISGNITCFALRIGLNTTVERYWDGTPNPPLTHTSVGQLIKWNHHQYPDNSHYGYPFSLDGHIFKGTVVYNCVQRLNFNSVNSLEGSLQQFKYELQPCIAAFAESALISVPINRVQSYAPNVAGVKYGVPTEQLNKLYLQGNIIDYDKIDFSGIKGTHQELEYKFRSL